MSVRMNRNLQMWRKPGPRRNRENTRPTTKGGIADRNSSLEKLIAQKRLQILQKKDPYQE